MGWGRLLRSSNRRGEMSQERKWESLLMRYADFTHSQCAHLQNVSSVKESDTNTANPKPELSSLQPW